MKNKTLKNLCVCAVCVALAMALSYLKIPIGAGFGGWGGSIDLVMIPIILAAVYGGVGWGLGGTRVRNAEVLFLRRHGDQLAEHAP